MDPRDASHGRSARRWTAVVGASLLLSCLAAVVAVVVALPRYVRRQCIAAAAARGVSLTIDGVSVGLDGARLDGVSATLGGAAGAQVRAPRAQLALSELSVASVALQGADIVLRGRPSGVRAALARVLDAPPAGTGASPQGATADAARTNPEILVEGEHLAWAEPAGDHSEIDASGVHFDARSNPGGTSVRLRSDNIRLAADGVELGPWSATLNQSPTASSLLLALDPRSPNTGPVQIMLDHDRTKYLDARILRAPLARFGIPAPSLGPAAELQATLHYSAKTPASTQLVTQGVLDHLQVAGMPRPFGVVWDIRAAGDGGEGMQVTKGSRVVLGPFAGALTGRIGSAEGSVQLDLTWTSIPIACSMLESLLLSGDPSRGIVSQLAHLAQATGATQTRGAETLRVTLAFDSRNPKASIVHFDHTGDCQVTLFGR